ncbi:MAG TPA: tRNA lysidine(34) synthetase TilS [Gemmatimonadaceae bacterium]|nr:tRNA lysidine(34) synthetase TilS [Gemmatimonadaceae bacterium]
MSAPSTHRPARTATTGAAARRAGDGGDDVVRRAVRASLAGPVAADGVVLAISGGRDSMVMLVAAAAVARAAIAAVATFDHGTGPAATAAADSVEARAAALGLPLLRGRATVVERSEAGWREARWRFLRDAARSVGARRVATGHTADDQVETVFLRALRGAGARGLAALAAPAAHVVRPLLGVRRADVTAYAKRRGVAYVDDPSNAGRAYARNRARLDLLPAIERAHPGFADAMLAIGERAAAWRAEVDALARELAEPGREVVVASRPGGDVELRVADGLVTPLDLPSLAVLWPALAALVGGLALDRRGTRRLAEFTRSGRPGGAIQLAGGVEVVRRRGEFVLRRGRGHTSSRLAASDGDGVLLPTLAEASPARLGEWEFEAVASASGDDPWALWLARGEVALARPWRAGDRMRSPSTGAARRVKRYFGDAGVAGVDRAGWPVIVVGGEIVWIPGVRRAHAAPARSGRPGVWLTCRTVVREPSQQ